MKRDHLRRAGLRLAVLAVAGLASMALPSLAGAASAELAVATVYSGGVDFRPNVEFSRATLTVSGNGNTFQHEFEAGDYLSIGMFDPAGQLLADGVYSWQLQLVPDAAAARELRLAAAEARGKPAGAWEPLSGSFAIRGGVVADLDSAEEQTVRRAADVSESPRTRAFGASAGREASGRDDAGFHAGREAELNAAARRQAPATRGAIVPGDRAAGDRSDAATLALGRSLEPARASSDNQLSAQSRSVPRPRSDGSNGRPRS